MVLKEMAETTQTVKWKPQRLTPIDVERLRRQHSTDSQRPRFNTDISLRRTQSAHRKTAGRNRVVYRAKSRAYVRVTLTPEKSPRDSNTDFELSLKGTKDLSNSFKDSKKSYKVYLDETDSVQAEIIVKKNKKEVERIPLGNIKQKQKLFYREVGVTVCPEVKMPELRTYNTDGFLCNEEKSFLEKRKFYVRQAVQKLMNQELLKEEVPNIALMGSGGGYRAMTAMSGVINALHDTKIFDTVLYTVALSGSSWYLAVLYSDESWPDIDPRNVQTKLRANITSKKHSMAMIFTKTAFSFLTRKTNWSFTSDIFGPLLGESLIPDRTHSRWSEQAMKLNDGTAPLPLLAAIHAKPDTDIMEFHEWVEFSPYEVNLSKYGAAIKMKHFGSKFQRGIVERQEKELPLHEIMGICGSAYTVTFEELNNKEKRKGAKRLSKSSTMKQNAINGGDEIDGPWQGLDTDDDDLETDGPCDELESIDDVDELDGLQTRIGTESNCDELDGPRPKLWDESLGNECSGTISGCFKSNHGRSDDIEIDGSSYDDHRLAIGSHQTYELRNSFQALTINEHDSSSRQPNQIQTTDDDESMDVIDTVFTSNVQQNTPNAHFIDDEKFDSIEDCNIFGRCQTTVNDCNEPSEEDLEELLQKLRDIRETNDALSSQADLTSDPISVGSEGDVELDGVGDFIVDRAKRCFLRNRTLRAAAINNFLHRVSFEDKDKKFKSDMETLLFIDAGLALNSPYPLLFQPGRDIDLILSFEFTDRHQDLNHPFKMILKAEKWARQNAIKFPPINIDKFKGRPIEEVYVFDDDTDVDCPTIMHFVLVNKHFWKYEKPGEERSQFEKQRLKNFKIFDHGYYDCKNFNYTKDNFDNLAQLAEFIVLNNVEKIKDCILKTIQKKRKQRRRRHNTN